MEKLISKYNQYNSFLVISEFPPQKSRKGSTGLSWYSQNIISALHSDAKRQKRKAIILANKSENNKEEIYEDRNILVIRCFQRNKPLSFLRVAYYALRLNKVKTLLFEFEFATYSTGLTVLVVPVLLAIFKLFDKKVCFSTHQVVLSLRSLNAHLGFSKTSFILKVLEQGLFTFYRIIGLLVNQVIVLEEEFKLRLSKFVNPQKISLIPLGIESQTVPPTANYRRELNLSKNDFVILIFGYVAWYKGVDVLINAFKDLPKTLYGKKVKLIIAGGKSPTQTGKAHYEHYFKKISKLVASDKRVTMTGFVTNKNIKKYFISADLCVVPYQRFISSSGPLSFAFSYKKPVLLSQNLIAYSKSPDFQSALQQSGLMASQLFKPITMPALKETIENLIKSPPYHNKMVHFSNLLYESRKWDVLKKKYESLLFTAPQVKNNVFFMPVTPLSLAVRKK